MNKQQHLNQRKKIDNSNTTNQALAIAVPVVALVVLGGTNWDGMLPYVVRFISFFVG